MFNIPVFQEYVRANLVGDMTQVAFAAKSGVSPEHLSRMLRSKNPPRPSKLTLKKLAGDSVDTYHELLALCGYSDKPASSWLHIPVSDLVQGAADELRSGLRDMTKNMRAYESLDAFLDEYMIRCDSKHVSFAICGEKKEYDRGDHFGAEYVIPVTASFPVRLDTCEITFALFFSETKKGRYVILDGALDIESVISSGAQVSKEKLPEAKALSYYHTVTRKWDREEWESRAEETEEYGCTDYEPITVCGFGVSFTDGDVPRDLVKKFLVKHQAGKYDDKAVNRYLYGNAEKDDGFIPMEEDIGGGLIARILREETGINFHYYGDETGNPYAISAIMVRDSDLPDTDMDGLKEVCNDLASILGAAVYGTCVVHTADYICKEFFQTTAGK